MSEGLTTLNSLNIDGTAERSWRGTFIPKILHVIRKKKHLPSFQNIKVIRERETEKEGGREKELERGREDREGGERSGEGEGERYKEREKRRKLGKMLTVLASG